MEQDKLYKDAIHGFTARCNSKRMAWMLIRNECHEQKLEVPTIDKIVEIKDYKFITDNWINLK